MALAYNDRVREEILAYFAQQKQDIDILVQILIQEKNNEVKQYAIQDLEKNIEKAFYKIAERFDADCKEQLLLPFQYWTKRLVTIC